MVWHEARHLISNLEEAHMKMWENVNSNLAKYLEPLLDIPSEENYH